MAEYQRTRDEHLAAIYEFTSGLATLEPPPPEIQALYGALINNRADTDRFVGIFAGTVGVQEFFAPENIGRIISQASAAGAN
jgi:hypothetical protein